MCCVSLQCWHTTNIFSLSSSMCGTGVGGVNIRAMRSNRGKYMGRQVLQLEQRLLAEVNIEEMHSYTQRAPTVQSIPGTLVDNIFYCIIWWLFPCLVFKSLGKTPCHFRTLCVQTLRIFQIKVCRKIRTQIEQLQKHIDCDSCIKRVLLC